MYASIPDALRALARKIGADANGRNEEEILNNIVVKLGGEPTTNRGIAGAIDAITKVADIDDMHVLTTKTVTANGTYTASDDDADGYSSVTVNVATPVPETFAVTMSLNSEGVVTSNKTYSEMVSAIDGGKNVQVSCTWEWSNDPGDTITINSIKAFKTSSIPGHEGTFNAVYLYFEPFRTSHDPYITQYLGMEITENAFQPGYGMFYTP